MPLLMICFSLVLNTMLAWRANVIVFFFMHFRGYLAKSLALTSTINNNTRGKSVKLNLKQIMALNPTFFMQYVLTAQNLSFKNRRV